MEGKERELGGLGKTLLRQSFGEPTSGSRVIRAGWLNKEGHLVRNWKRRWFVLEKSADGTTRLAYFENEGSGRLKGELGLSSQTRIEVLPSKDKHLFALLDGQGRCMLKMEADTEDELRAWACVMDYRFHYHTLLAANQFAVERLSKPQEFLKHGRRGNPHLRFLFLSPDQSSLCWRRGQSSDLQQLPLDSDDVAVVSGATTAVFKRSGTPGLDHCCFSVLGTERTLDLQAKTQAERDVWVRDLGAILEFQRFRRKKRGPRGGGSRSGGGKATSRMMAAVHRAEQGRR